MAFFCFIATRTVRTISPAAVTAPGEAERVTSGLAGISDTAREHETVDTDTNPEAKRASRVRFMTACQGGFNSLSTAGLSLGATYLEKSSRAFEDELIERITFVRGRRARPETEP